MTRIISTVAFRFIPPVNSGFKSIGVKPLEISEVPSWVEKTGTFKSGVAAGKIKVMTGMAETVKVEAVQSELKGTIKQKSDALESSIVATIRGRDINPLPFF